VFSTKERLIYLYDGISVETNLSGPVSNVDGDVGEDELTQETIQRSTRMRKEQP
jgi:hypothetical protein